MEKHLKSSEILGRRPFIIWKKITYADTVIYRFLRDEDPAKYEKDILKIYPGLLDLVIAVGKGHNIKNLLSSEAYLGWASLFFNKDAIRFKDSAFLIAVEPIIQMIF